jgi:fatty-acyl-CoA synthase
VSWNTVTTVADLVTRAAAEAPTAALVFPDERATVAELDERAEQFARALRAHGVRRGDHVGLLAAPGVDYVAIFLGAAKLGAVPVPINARFKGLELAHVVPHADLVALFASGGDGEVVDYAELVAPAVASAPALRLAVHLPAGDRPGFHSLDAFLDRARDVSPEEVRHEQSLGRVRDLGMIMYTSGTTSSPKGCMLTEEAMVRQAFNYVERYALGPDEAFWDALPLFHIGGIIPLLACLSAGSRFVHPGAFDPGIALGQLVDERCTVAMPVFDTIWFAVLNHPDFDADRLRALRSLLFLGGPETLAQAQARIPHAAQVSGTGSTESCGNLALGSHRDPPERRTTTCGRLMAGWEVRIVDLETGADLPPGKTGELLFRGVGRFEGYYKDPELTAQVIDAEGWFHSGDLATIDRDGYVTYGGRHKDALKVGGENVSPLEIEDFLARHPAVVIAQVVGVPDARYSEVPAVFVELVPDASVTPEEIVEFCLDEMATFKVPRYVRFVTEWPMSGTKIEKRTLRERLTAELSAAGITEAPPIRGTSSRSTSA